MNINLNLYFNKPSKINLKFTNLVFETKTIFSLTSLKLNKKYQLNLR